MPMTQDDIRTHYESEWSQTDGTSDVAMSYADPVERAVAEPIYRALVSDVGLGSPRRVMDVGCGSGRWCRFLHETYGPDRLVGVDFARASVELLKTSELAGSPGVGFEVGDVTSESWGLGEQFDLINIANVLFHVPEPDKFDRALMNLRSHLAEGGRVLLTDYLPRIGMRTEWMLVRSRYEWEQRLAAAGLKIVAMRPMCVFTNDPMGIDGTDSGARQHFNRVRGRYQQLLKAAGDPQAREFILGMMVDIERAVLAFCEERVSAVEMPSQKLIALCAA